MHQNLGYKITKEDKLVLKPIKSSQLQENIENEKELISNNSIIELEDNEDSNQNSKEMILPTPTSLARQRSLREKKATIIEDFGYIDKEKTPRSSKNPLSTEVYKKCEKIFAKLKRHQLASEFISNSKPDIPSLSPIEKTLRSYAYQSVYQFGMDVRKIWNYYFSNFGNTSEIFKKAFAFSNFFEMIFKEVDNFNEDKSDNQELNKKLERLTKEIKEIDRKNTQVLPLKKQESRGVINIMEKPMNMAEKNSLGNSIRMLTQEQLKGVISIVSENMDKQHSSKYFEFDIEILPTRVLRELEKYTKMCLKNKGASTPKSQISINKFSEQPEGIDKLALTHVLLLLIFNRIVRVMVM